VTTTNATKPLTMEQALQRGMLGWSVRCNRCGSYGAEWLPNERPGWGSLALCPEHTRELRDETARHYRALQTLRAVNFEQEWDRAEHSETLIVGKRWPPSPATLRRRARAKVSRSYDD
jgi:hypothetical protein